MYRKPSSSILFTLATTCRLSRADLKERRSLLPVDRLRSLAEKNVKNGQHYGQETEPRNKANTAYCRTGKKDGE